MDKLTLKMSRAAYRALKALSAADDRKALLTLSLELPLLLRRHGLLATLAFWSSDADHAAARLASSFLDALREVASIGDGGVKQALQRLREEPLHEYLLHSRLALALADAWVELAEPLLEVKGSSAPAQTTEVAHAEAKRRDGKFGTPPSETSSRTQSPGGDVRAAGSRDGASVLRQTRAATPKDQSRRADDERDFRPMRADVPSLDERAQRNAHFELYSAACYRASRADSQSTTEHFDRICRVRIGDAYRRAYARWEQAWKAAGAQHVELAFSNRLLIGLSNPSLWESGITLNPTYGTPVIPGSACKGLARHFAESHLHVGSNAQGLTRELSDALFGKADGAGEVCFQDAWWVPDSAPELYGKDRPFVREVVTPHHKDFLDSAGAKQATPFDSPVPVPQIAAHGRFLFVVTGAALWAQHALDILRVALSMEGIGARTPEYGRAQSAFNRGRHG